MLGLKKECRPEGPSISLVATLPMEGDLDGGEARLGNQRAHILHRQLVQQVVPEGIVIVLAGQVRQHDAVAGAGGGMTSSGLL